MEKYVESSASGYPISRGALVLTRLPDFVALSDKVINGLQALMVFLSNDILRNDRTRPFGTSSPRVRAALIG
jgi:hypothetical protein